jgi:hypothetical protein
MTQEIKKHERAIAICKMVELCNELIYQATVGAQYYQTSDIQHLFEQNQKSITRWTTIKNYLLTRYTKYQPCTTQ